MVYGPRKKKISQFTAGSTLTDDTKYSSLQDGINKTFTQEQILENVAEVYGASLRMFEFESDLILSDIQIDEHCIVEENRYTLYKITSVAANLPNIALDSGFTAERVSILEQANPSTYAEILAENPDLYAEDDVVYLSGDEIAGDFKVVASAISASSSGVLLSDATWNAAGKHLARAYTGLVHASWFDDEDSARAYAVANSEKLDVDEQRVNNRGPDLFQKMLSCIPGKVNGMYVQGFSGSTDGIKVGVGMGDTLRSVIEYQFQYDGDGLLLLRGARSGREDTDANGASITLNGTFNTTSEPETYTTTEGDTFDFSFTGSGDIYFRSRVDDRGGIWDITLDNGMTRRVSTYAPVTDSDFEQLIFEDLPYRAYTGSAEFIGDDPYHVPSTGAGNARGWIHYRSSTDQRPISYGRVKPIDTTGTLHQVITVNSIPDFAILAKPSGAVYSSEWVPNHGAETGVSTSILVKVLIDGVLAASTTNFDFTTDYTYRQIESFKILQEFDAVNPNGSDGTMWVHKIQHSVTMDEPFVSITQSIDLQQDTEFELSYFAMLASDSDSVDRVVYSDGYTVSGGLPTDGSEVDRPIGPISAAYTGTYSSGVFHGCAVRVSSLQEANNYGGTYQPTTDFMRQTYRADTVVKTYWNLCAADAVVASGTRMTCRHDILAVTGVRNPNDDIGVI